MSGKKVIKSDSLLVNRIGDILKEARNQTVHAVNIILVKTYWEIGKEIVEHELGGKYRAEYGTEFLKKLAKELTTRQGKGLTHSNLRRMHQFYFNYEICATVSHKSEWNEILSIPSRKLDETKVPTLSAQSLEAKNSKLSRESDKTIESILSAKSFLSDKMLSRLSWSHICLLLSGLHIL